MMTQKGIKYYTVHFGAFYLISKPHERVSEGVKVSVTFEIKKPYKCRVFLFFFKTFN